MTWPSSQPGVEWRFQDPLFVCQIPLLSSGYYLYFSLTGYNPEVPKIPSLDSMNLLEQLRELREAFTH